jgi:hypothetical protein
MCAQVSVRALESTGQLGQEVLGELGTAIQQGQVGELATGQPCGPHLQVVGADAARHHVPHRFEAERAQRTDVELRGHLPIQLPQRWPHGHRHDAQFQYGLPADQPVGGHVALEGQPRLAAFGQRQPAAKQRLRVDDDRVLTGDDHVLVVQIDGPQCVREGEQSAVAPVAAPHRREIRAVSRRHEPHEAVVRETSDVQIERRQPQRVPEHPHGDLGEALLGVQRTRLVHDAVRTEPQDGDGAPAAVRIRHAELDARQRR